MSDIESLSDNESSDIKNEDILIIDVLDNKVNNKIIDLYINLKLYCEDNMIMLFRKRDILNYL